MAALVSGEYYCERVAGMAQQALDMMAECVENILAGGEPDHEAMTMAQMISGLTMQMLATRARASGAEHLIAHLVEMKPPRFENAHGIHGECVGVGTILCAEEYHRMAAKTPKAASFAPIDEAWVRESLGHWPRAYSRRTKTTSLQHSTRRTSLTTGMRSAPWWRRYPRPKNCARPSVSWAGSIGSRT